MTRWLRGSLKTEGLGARVNDLSLILQEVKSQWGFLSKQEAW